MLANIQALRALAALLVVVVHLETLGGPIGLGKPILGLFAVGVDLFFVISGFIMVYTTSRRPTRPDAFLLNRLLRIAPVYWLLTLAVFVLALASPSLLGTTRADWGGLVRSLLFIPYERADGTVRPVLFVGWSLNLEMAFYLVFAAALGIRGAGLRVAMGISTLVLAVALGSAFGSQLSVPLRFLTQPLLLEFACGMALGWLFPRLRPSHAMTRAAVLIAPAALLALVLAAMIPTSGGWPLSALPATVLVLAALIAEKGGVVADHRFVQATGDASYSLYLVHPFVTQAWTILAGRAGIVSAQSAPFLMLVALVSAIGTAIVFHRTVEKPLNGYVQRRLEQVSARRKRADLRRTVELAE